jgi:CDP-glycerol glycerophosphotransferase (TagB/SpsB family)
MIARVCYLSYGPTISKGRIGEIVQPEAFFRYVSLFFAECDFKKELFENKFGHCSWFKKDRILVTGYPKTDHFKKLSIDENNLSWKREVSDRTTRILWSPRWNTGEGLCHFFDYKDFFIDFCKKNDDVDFVFRPHPLFWQNFEKTGELTVQQQSQMRDNYKKSPNMAIDSNSSCEDTFRTCDILVSDFSSMMIEFYPAEKPIIYTHRKDVFNEYAARMAEGVYWVNNEHELSETLSMLLSGKDPLREKREQLMESLYYMPECGVGELIKKSLQNDFVNS